MSAPARTRALLLAALAAAGAASAARTDALRRGDLTIGVLVGGTVVPEDVFRLKSTIDGRVETVEAQAGAWRGADQNLATLAHKELAAMIDARGAQDQGIMEDRWQNMYRTTPIRCPATCYVLKSYVKKKSWVKAQAAMFEAARHLKLVGRVRPEEAHLVRDGQTLTFWPVGQPEKKMTGRVARYMLDVQGERVSPGGSFAIYLSPERFLAPGTEWEGRVEAETRRGVLYVPTSALIRHEGGVYLPVRVSTGATSADYTQITAGVDGTRDVLILDDAELEGADRHGPQVDPAAVDKRLREQARRPQKEEASGGAKERGGRELDAPARRRPEPVDGWRQPSPIDDKDYGDDPYGEQ